MRSRSSASLLARAFAAVALLASASVLPARAADYPAPVERDWIARDFRFHTGEVMPELRLHVTTVGAPTGEPVLVLHGTAGSAAGLLVPSFAGELFGPGQALDATRYFIIIPDAIGTGKSAKPSDGLRAAFPHYDYGDMVEAQYRVVTEALGVRHLRLVLGNSMGGMHAWLWAERHPQFMDALVPMACQPTEMAGRNWMMRRLLVETIRGDPGWNGGNYTSQPKSLALANVYFGVATSGGSQAWYQAGPTRKQADAVVDARLAAPFGGDANDTIWQWESSSDYDAAPELERIAAMLLAINSADDERNPPELKIMEREIRRVRNGRFLLLPASTETRGHGTTGLGKFIQQPVAALLREAPHLPM